MKLFATFFTLFLSISCSSQLLDTDATLKYINDIFFENKAEPYKDFWCWTDWITEMRLEHDGYLTITSYKRKKDCPTCRYRCTDAGMTWVYKRSAHISEINLTGIQIEKDYKEYLVVPCKSGECWTKKTNREEVYSYNISYSLEQEEKIQWSFGYGDSYTKKKLANAIVYLLSSAIESGTYNRDEDDPFAPKNFSGSKYHVTGNSNSTRVSLRNVSGVTTLVVAFGNDQLKEEFILDTGAGNVSISKSLEQKLIAQSLVNRADYISSGLYKVADGSIITCRRLIIPKITVGGFSVYNVTAAVSSNNSPLLLGKNFLDKFSSWSIDNSSNTLILNK